MNKFIGLGHLTRDPELRYTPTGTPLCNAGLALNRKWKSENGQEHEDVCFIDCVFWGRTAEVTAQYCRKGKKVLVEGRLRQQMWEDKNTHQQRSKIVVQVETVQFMDSAGASRARTDSAAETQPEPPEGGTPNRTEPSTDMPATPTAAAAPAEAQEDDDVPF